MAKHAQQRHVTAPLETNTDLHIADGESSLAINESRRSLLKQSFAFAAVSTTALATMACTSNASKTMSSTQTFSTTSTNLPPKEFNPAQAWTRADEIVANIKTPQIPNRDFNITDFGAKPGKDNDALPAIRAAIISLVEQGGGRVVIPAGFWFVKGPIHFVSNMELHVSEDAHLQFSGGPHHYMPLVKTRWEGTECYNYSPFIYALACHNIALTGKGKIDGQGRDNFLILRPKQKPDQRLLRNMGRDGVPVEQRRFGPGHYLRPHFVQFYECKQVLVDGPHLVDSPFWCIHPVYCDQVIVRNVKIDSRHVNSDGVDPDSSTNVLVENCNFNVDDDGVAIKAGRDQDGWRVGRKSQNIVVRNCEYTGSKGGGMAIGSEMSGGVTDVYVENYKIPECRHMLYFKANNDRGGEIERIYIRNIRSDYAETVIIFTNDYHSYRGGNYPTSFKNIVMEDVICERSKLGIHVFGNETAPVKNVTLRDIEIKQSDVVAQVEHVENLVMDNVRVNGNVLTTELAKAQPKIKTPKH
uniref:glycoside hydrolase family 28 protein n=1 Tax=Ningiella ruwaisensis TaxID=2364274 RepID=UPI0010A0C354|nr:glycoside hydrolase family 28 protein [Ningiella ruwaisensis]